jgi:hypothetical protein
LSVIDEREIFVCDLSEIPLKKEENFLRSVNYGPVIQIDRMLVFFHDEIRFFIQQPTLHQQLQLVHFLEPWTDAFKLLAMRQNVEKVKISLIVISLFDEVRVISCKNVERSTKVFHGLALNVIMRGDSTDLGGVD